jgi:glucose-6-phosphate-specific signal transduction histidine kinase
MNHSQTSGNYVMLSARWSTGRNVLMLAALISIVACAAGYIQDPDRFFRSYLVAFTFTCAIGLAAFFFVMVQFLSGSAWSVVMRRLMENIMITLPVGALLFLPLAFGLNHVYPWANAELMKTTE